MSRACCTVCGRESMGRGGIRFEYYRFYAGEELLCKPCMKWWQDIRFQPTDVVMGRAK